MRKLITIFLIGLFMFGLVGCTKDNGKEQELEERIEVLEELVDLLSQALEGDMQGDLKNLSDRLAVLARSVTALEKSNSELTERVKELETQVDDLLKQFNSAGLVDSSVSVFLAKEYHLVVGDNFQLFYRSIVQAVNPYGYYIRLTGKVGHAYNRYFEFLPEESDAGKTYDLKVEVCDNNGNVFGEASTKLVVNKNKISPIATKNVLCVGDSLTVSGDWVKQGSSKYTAAGGKINLLGTITSNGVKHEGHGGWQWSTFINDDSSPFRSTKTASKVSFKEYCDKNGFTQLDEVYFLLTWNGVGGSFRTFDFSSEPMRSAKVIIDQLHTEYPNVKITLLSIPLPSLNAGLGAYYTLGQSYADNYGQLVTAMNYDHFLQEWAELDEYKDFVRFEDSKGQFDSEYNMPTSSKPVNNENNTQEQVGNAMGMHPSTNGYLQIGDAFYRALMHEWK